MAKIIFTLGGDTFTFDSSRSFPVDDPVEVLVMTEQSAGGQMYAYDKGVAIQWHNLFFKSASDGDYANVADWIENVAVGPKNTFTYTDEAAAAHTVRIMHTKNPLKKNAINNCSGTIILREEV